MLRPFDPFRETMHDTTGLSPYIETDFRYGRKPVSISSEGYLPTPPKVQPPEPFGRKSPKERTIYEYG